MSGRILNKVVTDKLLLYVDGANSSCYVSGNTILYDLVDNKVGSLVNGVTYSTSNKGYFVLDGVNDYIDLDNKISSLAPSYPMSIDAWVWPSSTNGVVGIFSSANDTPASRYYGFSIQLNTPLSNGKYYIFANVGDGFGSGSTNRRSYQTSTQCLVANEWNHIVATVDSGPTFQIYLNGVLQNGSASGTGGVINWGVGTTTQIGPSPGYGAVLNGKVSNVKFYNKLLSQSEITQNYNALKGRFGLT
jgi:hypothetical protein